MFAGQVKTGGSSSTIVTVNEQVAELPLGSVAVQVTVVVPTGNVEPDVGTQPMEAPQLSAAVTVKNTTALQTPVSVPCVMGPGQVMVGGSVSVTVTVKLHEAVLPLPSVAVQVTAVTPTGKNEPDAGAHVTVRPGQLSVAVAAKLTVAPH
jgi:hypothetical protein